MKCQCDDCGHICDSNELRESQNLSERMDFPVGHLDAIEPEGDCPECGAFSYAVTTA